MNFTAFSQFIVDSGLAMWDFMLSNILTASILVVCILFPKLFNLFRKFIFGK